MAKYEYYIDDFEVTEKDIQEAAKNGWRLVKIGKSYTNEDYVLAFTFAIFEREVREE